MVYAGRVTESQNDLSWKRTLRSSKLKGLRGGLIFISVQKKMGLKAEGRKSVGRLRGEVKTSAFGWLWFLSALGRAGLALFGWTAVIRLIRHWDQSGNPSKPVWNAVARAGGSGAVGSKPFPQQVCGEAQQCFSDRKRTIKNPLLPWWGASSCIVPLQLIQMKCICFYSEFEELFWKLKWSRSWILCW